MNEKFVIELNGRFMKVYSQKQRAEHAFQRWMQTINTNNDLLRMIGIPSGHIYNTNE